MRDFTQCVSQGREYDRHGTAASAVDGEWNHVSGGLAAANRRQPAELRRPRSQLEENPGGNLGFVFKGNI